MSFPFSIPDFEDRSLTVAYTGWNGVARLNVDGKPAPAGDAPNQFRLTRADGSQVTAQVLYVKFGLVPVLQIEGHRYPLPSPLRWFHWPLVVLPLFLVAIGGMLGGVFGAIGFVLNTRIMSGDRPGWLKVFAALVLTALMTGLFYASASLVTRLLGD